MNPLRISWLVSCSKSIAMAGAFVLLNASCSTMAPTTSSLAVLHSVYNADLKGRAMLIGRLTDIKDGKPVQGAAVTLVGTATDLVTPTDDNGNYAFSDITPGQYVVNTLHLQYISCKSSQISLTQNSIAVLDFRLVATQPQVLELN
jgi:hypothetical protein